MTTTEIITKIEELKEMEELIAEAQTEAETIKDTLKKEMNEQNVEELIAGTHIIRWTTVLSNRFDTTSFKKTLPDVYKAYTKTTQSRRFTIS